MPLSVYGARMAETTVKPARKVELDDETSLIVETAKRETIYINPHGDNRNDAVGFVGHSTGTEPNAEREIVELEFWSKAGEPRVTLVAPSGESLSLPVDRDALEFHQSYFESEIPTLVG